MPKLSAQKAKKTKRVSKKKASKDNRKILAVFLTSSLIVCGWLVYKIYLSPFASALSTESAFTISSDFYSFAYVKTDDFNPLIEITESDPQIKEAHFVVVDIPGKKILDYNIPLDTEVDVPGKFGVEKYSSLLRIAALTQQNSIHLANSSMFKTFAYPISRYIYIDEAIFPTIDKALWQGSLIKFLTDTHLFARQGLITTNFTSHELYNLVKFMESLPGDRIQKKDLSQTYISQPGLLDSEILDITFKSSLSEENRSIAILNGTDTPGIATFSARVSQNLGGRVIVSENAQNKYDESLIIASDTQSATVATLSQVFNISKILHTSDAGFVDEYAVDRADITVILGFDVVSKL